MSDQDRKKRIEDKARFVGGRPWTAEETERFAGLVRRIKAKKTAETGGNAASEKPAK